jgi:hypothetical protein
MQLSYSAFRERFRTKTYKGQETKVAKQRDSLYISLIEYIEGERWPAHAAIQERTKFGKKEAEILDEAMSLICVCLLPLLSSRGCQLETSRY